MIFIRGYFVTKHLMTALFAMAILTLGATSIAQPGPQNNDTDLHQSVSQAESETFDGRIDEEAEDSAGDENEESLGTGDFITIGVYIFLILAVGGILFYTVSGFKKQYSHFQVEHDLSEKEFETQLLDSVAGQDGQLKSGEKENVLPTETTRPVTPQMAANNSSSPEIHRNPVDHPFDLNTVAQRLQSLAILEEQQGKVSLPVPPDGLIYRLKRGGAAVIVPRIESAEVMNHLTKRFDLVFIALGTEEILVLERFQSRLKELTDIGLPDKRAPTAPGDSGFPFGPGKPS